MKDGSKYVPFEDRDSNEEITREKAVENLEPFKH